MNAIEIPGYYAVIDRTVLSEIKVLHVCKIHHAELYGRIYKANGRDVTAPPVDVRRLTKLERNEAQYLVWNLTGKRPSDVYGENLQAIFDHLVTVPRDETDIRDLQKEVDRLYPEGYNLPQEGKEPKPPKDPNAPPSEPRKAGATKDVWTCANVVLAELGGDVKTVDWKVFRAKLVEACRAKGINDGTTGVQYSKWKASKLSEK